MFNGDYSLVSKVPKNVEETVWVDKKCVRPRLRPDELLLMCRLVDNQYWLFIQYCERPIKRDFTFKTEKMSAQKKGKREYLNDVETKDFTAKLNDYFETNVEIPRIKVGERQTI